jgi:hypothetical protein
MSQVPIVEEVRTTVITTDNDTVTDIDVITIQPQLSSIVDSPVVVDRDNNISESSRDIMSDSDPEVTATIDYLRRHRRERGNVEETECWDNLGLCFTCTVCDMAVLPVVITLIIVEGVGIRTR